MPNRWLPREYIRDAYGMSEIARMLELLSQGSSTEAALRATVHCRLPPASRRDGAGNSKRNTGNRHVQARALLSAAIDLVLAGQNKGKIKIDTNGRGTEVSLFNLID